MANTFAKKIAVIRLSSLLICNLGSSLEDTITRRTKTKKRFNRSLTSKQIINEQVETIRLARKAGLPIVFLEYDGNFGPTDPTLKEAVSGYKNVRYFTKDTDGMFDNENAGRRKLVEYLQKNNVGQLVVTGANGGACVRSSITGALASNCSVVAYTRGIADFNYREFIYPYKDLYRFPNLSCKNCTFKEVTSLDEVSKVINNATNSVNRSPRQYSVDSSEGVQ